MKIRCKQVSVSPRRGNIITFHLKEFPSTCGCKQLLIKSMLPPQFTIILSQIANLRKDHWPAVIYQSRQSAVSSPSTILRCLNRVALSFLTSWILSVDFLTSTWSFLLNMVQCEPPAAARTGTTIDDGAQDGPHRYRTRFTSALSLCQRHEVHGASLSRRIGVKFRTHLRSDVRDGHLESFTDCVH